MVSMLGKYPYETSVYPLLPIDEPTTDFESLFGDTINVNSHYRRDLVSGDVYLSRSRDEDAAALAHDEVVSGIVSGSLMLLTQDERSAVYGEREFQ